MDRQHLNHAGTPLRNSYFLAIPKQHSQPQRVKEFEEKFLQEWVSQLPVGNPRLSTRLLYDLVLEMNGLAMSPQLRLDSLELLLPVFWITKSYLRSKLLDGNFPKDSSAQTALDLLVEMERQLAIGYWLAAKAITGQPIGWFKGKQAALSILRCLLGLGGIVTHHYLMATPIPDWLWLDLHALYKLSVKLNVHDVQIPITSNGQANTGFSVKDCYLQTVLLSLASPSGLMGKEIAHVEKLVQKLSKRAKLKNAPIAGQAEQALLITDEDKAPFFKNQMAEIRLSEKNPSAVLFVDFSGVYKTLLENTRGGFDNQTRFSAKGGTEEGEFIAPEVLFYLQQRWSGVAIGNCELFSDRLDRLLAIGLANTHKLLFSDELSADNSEHLAQSLSGTLLSVNFYNPGALSIGSLVSLRKINAQKKQRVLAVVNEICMYRTENTLNIGVRLLTSQCIPAFYRCRDSAENERHGIALLLKPRQNLGKSLHMIIDTSIFKEGDTLSLTVKQKTFNVVVHNKANVALGYWQFECRQSPPT